MRNRKQPQRARGNKPVSPVVVLDGVPLQPYIVRQACLYWRVENGFTGPTILVTKSETVVAKFDNYDSLEKWYLKFRKLNGQKIEPPQHLGYFVSEKRHSVPNGNDLYTPRSTIGSAQNQSARAITKCSCGNAAIPGEDTCYTCKSE